MKRAMLCISVLVLALSWSVEPCAATTYYIDATGGDDKNLGTSEASAWQTLKKVDAVLLAGNTIRFKRGETLRLTVADWTGNGFWEITDKAGTSVSPITISDYGDAADPPPVLATLELWDGGWIQDGVYPDVWAHTGVSNGVIRCFIDGVGQGWAESLEGIGADSTWYHDDSLGVLYLYSQSDPAGSVVETLPLTGYVLQLKRCENILIENVAFYGGRHASVRLTGSEDEITVRDCVLRYTGKSGITGWDEADSLTNILIEGNEVDYMLNADEIREIAEGVYFPSTNVSDGIAFAMEASDVTIRGNVVRGFSHTGIQAIGKRSGRAGVHDFTIESNEVTSPFAKHCRGWGLIGAEGKCTNNVVRWNYVHDVTCASHSAGSYNEYYGNIIVDVRGDYSSKSCGLDLGTWSETIGEEPNQVEETMVCHNNSVFNNTIVRAEHAGILIAHGCSAGWEDCDPDFDDMYGNVIDNNIVAYCGSEDEPYQIAVDDIDEVVDIYNNVFGNNSFYVGGSGAPIMYKGTAYSAAAADVAALDDYFSNTLDSDPRFVDYAGDDYELFPNSPCKWTGDVIAVGYDDFNGDAFRNPPSRGAFEVEKGRGDADESEGAGTATLELSSRPNPFGPEASLHFVLPQAGSTRVTVYDPAGRIVAVLADGHREAGEHRVAWDGKDSTGRQVATGVYFARLSVQDRSAGSKMILIR